MEEIQERLLGNSKKGRLEKIGKSISFICIAIIVCVVASILYFVTSKGLSTFFVDDVSFWNFLTSSVWSPGNVGEDGQPLVGALPMITGSFLVTLLSAVLATPFAIGAAIFMTEISPSTGKRVLQPVVELLVGIPSVVYGFIGLTVIVPFVDLITFSLSVICTVFPASDKVNFHSAPVVVPILVLSVVR